MDPAIDLKSKKITIELPVELVNKLNTLKNELGLSFGDIYKEAIKSYLEQLEIKKWEKATKQAAKDKEYINFFKDISADNGDFYEY